MATLHARFGSRLGPVTIPIGVDADFKGVIDVIRMKARYFDEGSDSERIEDIPAEYADVAQNARDKLCDLVAEADDELMMKYLDGEEQLTQEELESLLDKAIAQELFIPVFVGSTIIKQGVQGVMEEAVSHSVNFPSEVLQWQCKLQPATLTKREGIPHNFPSPWMVPAKGDRNAKPSR